MSCLCGSAEETRGIWRAISYVAEAIAGIPASWICGKIEVLNTSDNCEHGALWLAPVSFVFVLIADYLANTKWHGGGCNFSKRFTDFKVGNGWMNTYVLNILAIVALAISAAKGFENLTQFLVVIAILIKQIADGEFKFCG